MAPTKSGWLGKVVESDERCSEEETSETRKFNERPKGVGRGKSRRAGRERKVQTGGERRGERGRVSVCVSRG